MPTPTRVRTPRPSDPYYRGVAVDGWPSLPYSLREASLIVLARVRRIFPARWTTPDGNRPANPHDGQRTIFTPVLVEVERYLKGHGGAQLYLWVNGGKIGQDEVFYSGTFYPPPEGEQVVLFLRELSQASVRVDGAALYYAIDDYRVTAEGRAVNRSQEIPLQQLLDQIATAAVATPTP